MMDATIGTRDKDKKDDAAAVGTNMKLGPPPSPAGIGKVRCSLCMLYVDLR